MKVRVRKGYVLSVGSKFYKHGEVIDIDPKVYDTQSWKVEPLPGEKPSIRKILSNKAVKEKDVKEG